jgi:hypothetical protein
MEQEQRMHELLQMEKKKEQQKEIENQKKIMKKLESMKIKEKIQNLKEKFRDYKVSENSDNIELHIRLPTGKRIVELFEKNKSVLFVKHYILQLDNNGICDDIEDDEEEEEEEDPYAIEVLWGYPIKKLQENLTLKQCFGDSKGESVTVKLT